MTLARVSRMKTVPRLQPPPPFPGASRPDFPHPSSFLATQSSIHLFTTQQNGRLATGETEAAGSTSQAEPLSKTPSPQDSSKLKQERAPAQVPNHGPLASPSFSRARFHSRPASRCPPNRCQARGPGAAWRGPDTHGRKRPLLEKEG